MSRRALGRGLDALFTQVAPIDHDLMEIDIDRLDPAEVQPRSTFKEAKLQELARSIQQKGVIQPLVVRRNGERFQIVAGERRWRAAQKAGLHRVPCIVKKVADEEVFELSLIENIQREELNPIEEANAFKRLLEERGLTQEELSHRVGKERSTISNTLRLLKLPPEVQKLVEEDRLAMGHARALLALDSVEHQVALAGEVAAKALSVRETERLVRKAHRAPAGGKQAPADNGTAANVRAAEAKLSKRLGAPVRIRFASTGGTVEIGFSSSDDLCRIFDSLMQAQTAPN